MVLATVLAITNAKLELIFDAHHYMSVPVMEGAVPRSDVQAGGTYHVTYPMMHVMYISRCGQNDGHTPVKTLPSSNFVTCADYKQTFRGCSHDAIATYCIW